MAIELSLDAIKDMKKADFVKGFKNKAVWKKAKAVIILVDYKLDGKKNVIAIPFKKETEMKQEMKRLKKEKLHLLKKSGGGSIEFIKAADGSMEAKIEITLGGLAPEILLMKGQPLFDKIKVKLQALQSAEAAAEAVEAAGEVDPNENLPEDDYDDVDDSEEEDAAALALPEMALVLKANIQAYLKADATEKENIKPDLIQELNTFEQACSDKELTEGLSTFLAKVQQLLQQLEKSAAAIQIAPEVQSKATELLEKMSNLMAQVETTV